MNGEQIAEKMDLIEGQNCWILKDCVVVAVSVGGDMECFAVLMDRDGFIVRQDVHPATVEDSQECRIKLDEDESPVGVWEDGLGETVCPGNGAPTMDTVEQILEAGEIVGGVTDPDGDTVQVRIAGKTVQIWLDRSFGDEIPADEDIICFAVRVGMGDDTYDTAVEVRRD